MYFRAPNSRLYYLEPGASASHLPQGTVPIPDSEALAEIAAADAAAAAARVQGEKLAALAAIDAASARALRELVLDDLGIVNLTGPERAAARAKLKAEDDKAKIERAK